MIAGLRCNRRSYRLVEKADVQRSAGMPLMYYRAPASRRASTIGSLPTPRARLNGVLSPLFLAFTSAPASKRAIRAGRFPCHAAVCSGVHPSSFLASMSAPASNTDLHDCQVVVVLDGLVQRSISKNVPGLRVSVGVQEGADDRRIFIENGCHVERGPT